MRLKPSERYELVKRLAPRFAGLVHNQDDGTYIVEAVLDALDEEDVDRYRVIPNVWYSPERRTLTQRTVSPRHSVPIYWRESDG